MHEKFDIDDGNYILPLGSSSKFSLAIYFYDKKNKKVIDGIGVIYDQKIITASYQEVVEFFTFLRLFSKKFIHSIDKNKFFAQVEKTEKNRTIKSLKFLLEKGVYISNIDAHVMFTIYHEFRIGKNINIDTAANFNRFLG
jgi:hypothetical protein